MAVVGSIENVSGRRIATPVRTAEPGQYTDEYAKDKADHHEGERLPRHQDGEAVQEQAEGFHRIILWHD